MTFAMPRLMALRTSRTSSSRSSGFASSKGIASSISVLIGGSSNLLSRTGAAGSSGTAINQLDRLVTTHKWTSRLISNPPNAMRGRPSAAFAKSSSATSSKMTSSTGIGIAGATNSAGSAEPHDSDLGSADESNRVGNKAKPAGGAMTLTMNNLARKQLL